MNRSILVIEVLIAAAFVAMGMCAASWLAAWGAGMSLSPAEEWVAFVVLTVVMTLIVAAALLMVQEAIGKFHSRKRVIQRHTGSYNAMRDLRRAVEELGNETSKWR